MKRYVMTAVWPLLLCASQAGAELRVIADLGGSDASVFYEAINRQDGSSTPPPVTAPLPAQGETLVLPVTTPEMTPGEVTPRPLQLPGIGALFLVGDDALSRQWLKANAAALRERQAVGMVVSVADENSLKTLRELAQLSSLPEGGAGVKYLRKINPYVFEELLLLAFERRGMRVIRNSRYSGDGGLDGQVLIDGERWLIQAKRYGRTIRPSHIDDFGELLRREGCRGFFVHTGRTGPASRARLSLWPDIELISGQRLLKLLNGRLLTGELTGEKRR